MRREPTVFSIMSGSTYGGGSVRFSEHARRATCRTNERPAADAIDTAFEEYSRVDVGASQVEAPRGNISPVGESNLATDSRDRGAARSITKDIAANIAAQLDLLDRQREQLAALLRDVAL